MQQVDVLILGGGLVGLALAAALDSSGLTSAVIDPADPERWDGAFDGRTSAISSSSMRMFETIGVTRHFPAPGCPIRTIQVSDGLAPGGLAFEPGEGEDEPLGVMHENRHLRAALVARAKEGRRITLRYGRKPVKVVRDDFGVTATLDDGDVIRAELLVAAEGRNSPTREAEGIRMARWSYRHSAVVSVLGHERPHGHVAYEIFYPAGPFALLPMTDSDGRHRSAIVWSVKREQAEGMTSLSDSDFAAEAEAAMGGFLGKVEMLAPRSTYPLGFHHAAQITGHRLALIGDAAHAMHPIAGQGVNVGYRDVAALAQVLVEGRRLGLDLGDAQILARYQRWRSLDTFMVSLATDGLTRLYGVPGKTASAVRRFGMGLVNRIGPLKERLTAEARGTSGDLPLLLRGLPI